MEETVQKYVKGKEPKFALMGLGFISESHIDAIEAVGGKIALACDIDTNTYFKVPDHTLVHNDWLLMMRDPRFKEVDYVSICTPNYLHFPMALEARARGKKVICEKPLVLSCAETYHLDNEVNTVLQLRHSPLYLQMGAAQKETNEVFMDIYVHRGEWYFLSWKNDIVRSGGMCMNIGVHYFDLLTLLFGGLQVEEAEWVMKDKIAKGVLVNDTTFISWTLSIVEPKATQRRQLSINGRSFNLNRKFESLHTKVYQDVLEGNGIKPPSVLNSIKLVNNITQKLGEDVYETV